LGMQKQSRGFRITSDALLKGAVASAAAFVFFLLVLLAYELISGSRLSLNAFGLRFLITTTWDPVHDIYGCLPFVYGTLLTSAIALLIGIPISLGVAICLVEKMRGRRGLAYALGTIVELLAAVPSVIFGLWGLFILAPEMRDYVEKPLSRSLGFLPVFSGTPFGLDFLTAGVILAIMIIPTVSAVSRNVLNAVPNSQREALYSLGGTDLEVVRHSILPYARSGLFGAIILGLGRAVGETMAVTMVIGNAVSMSPSLFSAGYTLASVIANQFTEASTPLFTAALVELGLVLFAVALLINVFARFLLWRMSRFSRVRV